MTGLHEYCYSCITFSLAFISSVEERRAGAAIPFRCSAVRGLQVPCTKGTGENGTTTPRDICGRLQIEIRDCRGVKRVLQN